MTGWKWHQLDHKSFAPHSRQAVLARYPSCRPTNSIKALKAQVFLYNGHKMVVGSHASKMEGRPHIYNYNIRLETLKVTGHSICASLIRDLHLTTTVMLHYLAVLLCDCKFSSQTTSVMDNHAGCNRSWRGDSMSICSGRHWSLMLVSVSGLIGRGIVFLRS